MSDEKIPQILIVDIEAGECQKTIAQKQSKTYRLSQVIALLVLTIFLTVMTTTLTIMPSARHALVSTEMPVSHEVLHSLDSRSPKKKKAKTTTTSTPTPTPTAAPAQYTKNVILPLYIDPGTNGVAWTPVYSAAAAYSNVAFTVIINPDNGPDTGSTTPDPGYMVGLQKLSSYPNIQVLGYVHQSYGARDYADVMADVTTWSTWGKSAMYNNAISGIFFDEGPSDTGDDQLYAQKINTATKAMSGFGGTPFVVQNPGILPPAVYFQDAQNCDLTIILEDVYANYQSQATSYNSLATKYGTSIYAFSFIFSALPTGMSVASLQTALKPMTSQAAYLFVTDLVDDIYSSFGPNWSNFVKALATM